MILRHSFGRPLTALCLSCAVAFVAVQGAGSFVAPAYAAEEANTVRPEIAKPLQAAQQAIQAKSYGQALTKLKEADAVSGRTPYEDSVIAQLRLMAALGAEEMPTAAKAFEALSGSGTLPAASKLQFTLGIASGYFRSKDYANAATWTNRYLSAGGTDAQGKLLLVQSLYLDKQYAPAAKAALDDIHGLEKQGQVPSETLLQVLAASAREQQDWKLYETALIRLVADYPKQDYWADLLHRLPTHAGFSERLSLDVSRLSLAAGVMTTAAQYMEFAELAIQAGLPGEAQSIVEKGYAGGVFGQGADAARHGRLRDLVAKAVDNDKKTLDAGAAEAAKASGGDPLAATGLDYYGYGQFDKATSLIEQGIAKGGLKSVDDAKLHLGIAYLAAGKKPKAIEVLKTVKGADGSADLAALWILKAGGRPY
ncbi:hypothetical protein [Telmatospirillum sp.]|uniref:hypothetical protein n=1 Tax=Telmatospirillum sp. TaxID=2079197 RepID=UPI0028511FC6|nr:hypothetical protein [Telmatospirillum sp.]MDR3438366.1 hypothetical protein [Telmatospirillum sp.]